MNEQEIKSIIRKAEKRYNIRKGLLQAVAYREYAKLYGWTDGHISELHSDGTSFGLFGLRNSTSVAEYKTFKGKPDTKTVEGQAEIAGWYLGKRIPQLLRHYNQTVSLSNMITAYNAGISKVISGETPSITQDYIKEIKEKMGDRGSALVPYIMAVVLIAFGGYQIL